MGIKFLEYLDIGKLIFIQIVTMRSFAINFITLKKCISCSLGNGVSDEYHVIRHCMNLEAVNTYEGKFIWFCRLK